MKNNRLIPDLKDDTSICGIRAECLTHICQDDLRFHQFFDSSGESVWVGAVADGCSGALGSENGSAFLVQSFIEEAERIGKTEKRNNQFLQHVIMALAERMTKYQPRNSASEISNYNGIEVSSELVATLYGFVIDNNQVLLVMAGDGLISINGHACMINQTSGDLYPVFLLKFPRNMWQKKLEQIFTFAEFPAERVHNLMLATDGFHHPNPNEYANLVKDPAMFILHAKFHATKNDCDGIPGANSSRGGDDATALIFARNNQPSKNLLSAAEVVKLGKNVMNHDNGNFRDSLEKIPFSVVRQCIMTEDDFTSSSLFRRRISASDGVRLFGITNEDIARYERLKNQIIMSRISASSDSNPLSFLSRQEHTRRQVPGNQLLKKPAPSSVLKTKVRIVAKRKIDQKEVTIQTTALPIYEKLIQPVLPKPKLPEKKGFQEKWIPFEDLCDYHLHRKHSVGFRHFGQVMYDLWHFVQECHANGLRLGNLRPKDLSVKINYEKEPGKHNRKLASFTFSLKDPANTARVDAKGKMVRDYADLDLNFIHPEYAVMLTASDKARLDQDWYAFSVLCCWFVTKFDPFGAGIVIAKPEADRIYRMKNVLLSQSSEVEIDEQKRLFIKRATGRLSQPVEEFVNAFIGQVNLPQKPTFLLDEFRQENILTCKTKIFKRGKDLKTKEVLCGFKQLSDFKTCGYCQSPHVKMKTISHAMFQTADKAATD